MAGNGRMLPAWDCLPFSLTRAFFRVDIVQDDRAKPSCTWVISSPVISHFSAEPGLVTVVGFKDGPSWCHSWVGNGKVCGLDTSEWFDKRSF